MQQNKYKLSLLIPSILLLIIGIVYFALSDVYKTTAIGLDGWFVLVFIILISLGLIIQFKSYKIYTLSIMLGFAIFNLMFTSEIIKRFSDSLSSTANIFVLMFILLSYTSFIIALCFIWMNETKPKFETHYTRIICLITLALSAIMMIGTAIIVLSLIRTEAFVTVLVIYLMIFIVTLVASYLLIDTKKLEA
ncbi:hypothetical protein BN85402990 [Alteracholeplasma palmae J233]|uniref:Uncharacterized protein n=1 Tax=Alteracholeplasma palmae (strain ATCC 49389 / J233) TaxID=1318466 RepID=U4KR49_ALTPJ|nr:hypothetical protein [Alteracholeplasma palmae]CCV63876.1 hypothetical protein BN85402990 [Alteracholeplasma palmae J233]